MNSHESSNTFLRNSRWVPEADYHEFGQLEREAVAVCPFVHNTVSMI